MFHLQRGAVGALVRNEIDSFRVSVDQDVRSISHHSSMRKNDQKIHQCWSRALCDELQMNLGLKVQMK